ncbi:hypothetical protein KKC88_03750 [Patescibacteria group bacterium]|nr:hypothetical protein [Patescibacteria group bacterium]MBU1673377.1 hypothetical protein [Patescibacteria group bacterium]MBU1963455.1 hypothetical protein [Patescibacteria group bacterium]
MKLPNIWIELMVVAAFLALLGWISGANATEGKDLNKDNTCLDAQMVFNLGDDLEPYPVMVFATHRLERRMAKYAPTCPKEIKTDYKVIVSLYFVEDWVSDFCLCVKERQLDGSWQTICYCGKKPVDSVRDLMQQVEEEYNRAVEKLAHAPTAASSHFKTNQYCYLA